ncbi:hypothetical protein D3C76_910760 [compost metagenome]
MQLQAFHFPGHGPWHWRAAQLAPQTGHDPQQGLGFGGTLRCLHRRLAQFEGQGVLADTLQHPNPAQPRARVGAIAIDAQGQGEVADAFAVLADQEQQLGPAPLQPRTVQGQLVDLGDDLFQGLAGFEALLAGVQEQAGIDVLTAAQTP